MHTSLHFSNATPACHPDLFLYDEDYGNAYTRQRFATDPKYAYFRTLLQLQRRIKANPSLYNKVFAGTVSANDNQESQTVVTRKIAPRTELFYHIERVNNLKFKVYKSMGPSCVFRKAPKPLLRPSKKKYAHLVEQYARTSANVRALEHSRISGMGQYGKK